MSKIAVLALFVALMGANVQATYKSQCTDGEPGKSELSCKSSASLNLSVQGRGRCTASANGYCAAFTKRSKDCVDYSTIYKGGPCRKVSVSDDAKCWAAAAAKAITSASTTVKCSGDNAFGCAKANAQAEAIACSLAKAIVDINVQLGHKEAECDAKVVAAISAIARAAAESQAKACSKNGKAGFSNDKDVAAAFEAVVADAFASCWAYCDGYGKSASGASGSASGTVVASGTFEFGDGASATTGP